MTEEKVMKPQEGWLGNNAYVVNCMAVGYNRHYCVCARLVNSYRKGTLQAEDSHGDCANEMRKSNCEAMAMVDQELAAGKSIFFTERTKFEHVVSAAASSDSRIDTNSESYVRGWNAAGSDRSLDRKMPGVEKAERVIAATRAAQKPSETTNDANVMQMDMAALVSDMTAAESEAKNAGWPVITATQGGIKKGELHVIVAKNNVGKTQLSQFKPMPGESMVEFAKRIKASRQANSVSN